MPRHYHRPKQDGERRVYVLPPDLVERIHAYGQANGFPSEVAAVRHLLTQQLDADTAKRGKGASSALSKKGTP